LKKLSIALLAAGIALTSMAAPAMAATKLEQTVDKVLGVSYRWGGTTTAGFDCSGFTMHVFEKFGISLPHQTKSQAKKGVKVAKSELRPGDLVFFNTNGKGISHVGVYMGNGEFAHSSSKYGVKISKLSEAYYANRYVTARRILSVAGYEKFAVEAPKSVAKDVAKESAPLPEAPKITNPADPIASATEEAELAVEDAQLPDAADVEDDAADATEAANEAAAGTSDAATEAAAAVAPEGL
jgi:murein DD-endopeptidase / murein LD-carboxypeptidase